MRPTASAPRRRDMRRRGDRKAEGADLESEREKREPRRVSRGGDRAGQNHSQQGAAPGEWPVHRAAARERLIDRDQVGARQRCPAVLGRNQRQARRQAMGGGAAGAPPSQRALGGAGVEPVGEPCALWPFAEPLHIVGDADEVEVAVKPIDQGDEAGVVPQHAGGRVGQAFNELRREFIARALPLGKRQKVGEIEDFPPGGEVAE